MLEMLMAKFTQDADCKDFLLKTGTRKLLEGTGDRKWGCGVPISKEIKLKNVGRNLLGLMLEKVRRGIQTKRAHSDFHCQKLTTNTA